MEYRMRLPRDGELFGKVVHLLGSSRFRIICEDEHTRVARIPGRLKNVKIKLDDLVLVKPWVVQSKDKCDICYRYTRTHIENLKKCNKYPNI